MRFKPTCRKASWERADDEGVGGVESVSWLGRRGVLAMLLFCPGCGNGLIVEEGQRCHRFACNTCPYVHNITRKVGPEGSRGCYRQRPKSASVRALTIPSVVDVGRSVVELTRRPSILISVMSSWLGCGRPLYHRGPPFQSPRSRAGSLSGIHNVERNQSELCLEM